MLSSWPASPLAVTAACKCVGRWLQLRANVLVVGFNYVRGIDLAMCPTLILMIGIDLAMWFLILRAYVTACSRARFCLRVRARLFVFVLLSLNLRASRVGATTKSCACVYVCMLVCMQAGRQACMHVDIYHTHRRVASVLSRGPARADASRGRSNASSFGAMACPRGR